MCHNVHGIGRHDQYGFRSICKYSRDNLAENGCVALEQLQPRFARLLRDSGTDHDRLASCQIFIFPASYLQGVRERHSMANIVCLGTRPRDIFVHQHNFTAHALHHQRIASRGANKAAANNSNFHGTAPLSIEVKWRQAVRRFLFWGGCAKVFDATTGAS
jgi:hypothetical protein